MLIESLVSMIIPTYNRAHLIGETLDSVLVQTYKNWECIVVDDGSTDYTEELLEFYCENDDRFIFIQRKKMPKGASQCRNIGLSRAIGEYIVFLDSDDILLKDCLKIRFKFVKKFPEHDFWVFPMSIKSQSNEYVSNKLPSKSSALIKFLSYEIPWQTTSTLWENKFLKSLNGFNADYPRLNDVEIHIRALLKSKSNFVLIDSCKPDFIYKAYEPNDYRIFAKRFYKSLFVFIPDITLHLSEMNMGQNIGLLRGYLKEYFVRSYLYVSRRDNVRLFFIFYKHKVFSIREFLFLYIQFHFYLFYKKLSKRSKDLILNIVSRQNEE